MQEKAVKLVFPNSTYYSSVVLDFVSTLGSKSFGFWRNFSVTLLTVPEVPSICKVALFPLIRVRAAREALVSFTLVCEHWIIPFQSSNPSTLISHSLAMTSPSSEEAEDITSSVSYTHLRAHETGRNLV